MPKNGMDMTEGVLIRWLVKVGDKVEKDDPIMEIETDKVTMDSEAPASGTVLALYCDEGETIPVLRIIGYIGAEGEEIPAAPPDVEEVPFIFEPLEMPERPEPPDASPIEPVAGFDWDVAIIGGGPAGYVAAIRAAQLGGKVVLFEKDTLGGTCLNRGCIPTKTYVRTAEYMEHIKRAAERGIVNDPNVSVDMPGVVAYKNAVVSKLTGGVAYLLSSYGVTVVNGEATAKSAHEVESGGKSYFAASLILCGGSAPGLPPIPGIEQKAVLTSNEILDIKVLPRELVILGGGVIGCEIACAFNAFGTNVTIIEMLPSLVANMGRKVADAIEKALKASGVDVYKNTTVTSIGAGEGGRPLVEAGDLRIEADIVLAATGRKADLTCLGALADGLAMERGAVVVNDRMETSIPGVYAAGDITGGMMLAHTAFKMAETAAANALGGHETCNLKAAPAGLYTMPEAASVGLDEEEARAKVGDRLAVGYFPLSANGRSLASGEPEGFVQVMVDKEYGELLGVRIVGTDAVEMIAEPAAMMAIEATADEIADGIVHAHPTYAEAFMEACADALGRCIHLPKK